MKSYKLVSPDALDGLGNDIHGESRMRFEASLLLILLPPEAKRIRAATFEPDVDIRPVILVFDTSDGITLHVQGYM